MTKTIIDGQTATASGGQVEGTVTYTDPAHTHDTAFILVGDGNSSNIDVEIMIRFAGTNEFADETINTYSGQDITGDDNARAFHPSTRGAAEVKFRVTNQSGNPTTVSVYAQTYEV